MKRLEYSVVVKVKVTGRFKIPVNVHLDNYIPTAEPFVTKGGMVMHHHWSVCHARRVVSYLQDQGHTEGSYNQI